MIRKPKNYRRGNMVYFVYNDLPHTGIIKYVGEDSFIVSDVSFLHPFDKDEVQISKYDCIKTGEIYLPKYPDSHFSDLVKIFDKNRFSYEAMPKRRIMGGTILSPIIEFTYENMFFLLDDDKYYYYRKAYLKDIGEVSVLENDNVFVIPNWIYQEEFSQNEKAVNEESFRKVNEHNIVAILQKDREYDNIICNVMESDLPYDEKEMELNNRLKLHLDIIYRRDHDGVLGTDFNIPVPFRHISGVITDARISK